VNDSPTAATSTITLPVFDVVDIILEARRSEIKVHTVHGHQLRDQIGFSLLIDRIKSVPIDEASPLRGVSMEIHKHL
jgi:hypothetical protein